MDRSHSHTCSFHILIFVLWNLVLVSSGCKDMERQALLSFKQSLSDPANRLSSWSSPDCCKWSGVSCHNKTGRIIKLDLRNQQQDRDWFTFNSQEVNSSLLHLKSLQYLDLSMNNFQLIAIPNLFGYFRDLTYLNLSNTSLGGELPESFFNFSLSNSSSYLIIDLSSNQLHGKIPNIVKSNHQSLKLLLNNNNFEGTLPHLPPNMIALDLSHNFLSGFITQSFEASRSGSFRFLNLAYNSFSGIIPHSFCKLKRLEALDLSGNKFTGGFPSCLCDLTTLYILDVSSNQLVGAVPECIGKMYKLKWLKLDDNKFNGQIPVSIKNCTNIIMLDLERNNFSGSIHGWIGENLQNLSVLSLRSNEVNGSIPLQLCWLKNLQFLDLAQNKLGTIPPCFPNFTHMVTGEPGVLLGNSDYKETVHAFTKGKEVEYSNILEYVTLLDLSSNNLVGEIPESLIKLHGLQVLNLSRNQLEGNIPRKIGNMKGLESLDLSQNRISGKIPQSLSSLNFLSSLNLSKNNLSGEIPVGHQLQTLNDVSIYMGNPLLCGKPITRKCRVDGPSNGLSKSEGHIKNGSKINWFYICTGSGYGVGLGIFCGVLFVSRKWRIAYYQFLSSVTDGLIGTDMMKITGMKRS